MRAKLLGATVAIALVAVLTWALQAPDWVPLGAFVPHAPVGVAPTCAAANADHVRICSWRRNDDSETQFLGLRARDSAAVSVRHVWRVRDSTQWRRTIDSVEQVIAQHRARQPTCPRFAHPTPHTPVLRMFRLRGYSLLLAASRPVGSVHADTRATSPWSVELFGGTLVLPCEPPTPSPRLRSPREMRDLLEQRLLERFSAQRSPPIAPLST